MAQYFPLAQRCATWKPFQFIANLKRSRGDWLAQNDPQAETCRLVMAAATYLLQHIRWSHCSSHHDNTSDCKHMLAMICATACKNFAEAKNEAGMLWAVTHFTDAPSLHERKQRLAEATLYLLQHGACCYPIDSGFTSQGILSYLTCLYEDIVSGTV